MHITTGQFITDYRSCLFDLELEYICEHSTECPTVIQLSLIHEMPLNFLS